MKKGLLIKILAVEVFVAVCALTFIIVAFWNKPLGPSLGLTTSPSQNQGDTTKALAQAGPGDITTPEPAAVVEPTATPASMLSKIVSLIKGQASSVKTLCNGPAEMTILLIGSDSRSEGYLYGLGDSIRLVRVDFVAPSVTTLDIPRDLWVEIPGISDHYGITHAKLNQAYFFGSTGMGYYDGTGEGPGLTAQTLKQNFGVNVDHYLAVDIKTFVRIIDAMDGIDIYNNSVIDLNQNHDGENPAYVLEPGTHHLDGSMALRLAMNRYPTIFQRAINQDIVLSAVESKLLSPAMLPRLPSLIAEFNRSVQTDLSPNDINKLVCLSQAVPKENIKTVAFPQELFTGGHIYDPYRKVNTYAMQADFSVLSTYFADFLNGIWP
jgi:LCP family protein required for cell wall assembly